MKWENRNINVVVHANKPQFNKPDNVGADLGRFE